MLPRKNILSLINGSTTGKGTLNLRKVLIVLQLTVLIAVSICAIIVNHQFNYLKLKNIGIDKEGVIKTKQLWDVGGA